MSTGLVCPSCSIAATYHRAPVTTCPHCDAPYPDALRKSAEANLAAQVATRPSLLTIGMYVCALQSAMFLLFMIMAPFDIGTYNINERQVSGPEFMRAAGAFMVVAGAFSAAIAIGLFREKLWTRPLMIWYWIALDAFIIVEGAMDTDGVSGIITGILMTIITLGLASWYLYSYRGVTEYYAVLEKVERANAPGQITASK